MISLTVSSGLRALCAVCLLSVPALGAIKAEPQPIPELRPPTGKLPEPEPAPPQWPWFVAAAALAAAGILLWPRGSAPKISEPPVTRARRELQALRHPDPFTLGRIVREYFIASRRLSGPGITFEELATALAEDPRWTPLLQDRFRRIADPIEIAKFAPKATPADLERVRDDALALIADADTLHRPPVPAPQ